MKKILLCLMLLSLTFIPSCDNNVENPGGDGSNQDLSNPNNSNENNQLTDKYGNQISEIELLTAEEEAMLKTNSSFETYLGKYDGYYVVLSYYGSAWTIGEYFAYNEMIFCFDDHRTIRLYKDEQWIGFQKACLTGLLSDSSIRNIYYYYTKYIIEYAEEEYASYYESPINFLECVYSFYQNVDGAITQYDSTFTTRHVVEETIKMAKIDDELSEILKTTFEYEKYFGLYNSEYHLYMIETEDAESSTYQVGDHYFKNDEKFNLVAVCNGIVYDFFELCENGTVSEEGIAELAQNFRVIQREYTYGHLTDEEFKTTYFSTEN